jgi:hypothetical protein
MGEYILNYEEIGLSLSEDWDAPELEQISTRGRFCVKKQDLTCDFD